MEGLFNGCATFLVSIHLLVREYLPVVLGSVASASLATPVTTYDPSVDPSILNEFATVAYR